MGTKCIVCGKTNAETRIIKDYCRRHYLQIYRHGKTFITIYDKNTFIENPDDFSAQIITRDKQGLITNTFTIDLDDLEKCREYKWYNKNGYCRTSSHEPRFFLHQFLIGYYDIELDVHHIDGDTTNNRKNNLIIVTRKENIEKMSKGHVRGIFKVQSGRYRASITHNYQSIYLGTFDTYEEAVKARKDAEIKYFKSHVN